tara:strand:+ start:305 stop:1522 length:1218 start_codon:yes stop_codon:yes gene_type:complete
MKISNCRICKSSKLVNLFSLGKLCFTGKFPSKKQIIKKEPIKLILCKNCQLVQLAHNFDLKYLYGPDYGYRTGINKTMLNHVRDITRLLTRKKSLKKTDMVLDIASNDGSLLNSYKSSVIKFGIDPILKKYEKNYKNIDYYLADFFSAKKVMKKTKKKFKIITALSVFYDARNPNSFLLDVRKILDNDGIFLLEFADLSSIIKFKMFDTICHEHLEYYSTKVICDLAKKHKLRVFDIKQNDINGGSKQYFICHTESRIKSKKEKINEILKNENKLELNKIGTFRKFIKEINSSKIKLSKKLKYLKSRGKIVHCYGASTKGNVLLQYYKIDKKLIEYAAERNEKKYGYYTPGSRIKIISEKLSRLLGPEYYLVLPWHFKKEILQRELKIRKKGVKFIFPLPNLKII